MNIDFIWITKLCWTEKFISIQILKQEGASEEDIHQLPKYKFRRIGPSEKLGGEISGPFGGVMAECGSDPPNEHVLSPEDAVSCPLRPFGLNYVFCEINPSLFWWLSYLLSQWNSIQRKGKTGSRHLSSWLAYIMCHLHSSLDYY